MLTVTPNICCQRRQLLAALMMCMLSLLVFDLFSSLCKSGVFIYVLRLYSLSMYFVHALNPITLAALPSPRNISASPILWICCPKLEHSLFLLELRGNRERINKSINHRGMNTGAVVAIGVGIDAITINQLR